MEEQLHAGMRSLHRKNNYICGHANKRGAEPKGEAEMIPILPDADNAAEGIYRISYLSIFPLFVSICLT